MTAPLTRLERKLAHLELLRLASMEESVCDYLRRNPPRGGKDAGREKRLYAQFAHILLSAPEETIPALLRLFGTDTALQLAEPPIKGTWRAYRLSTAHLIHKNGRKGHLCFPGAAGRGAEADVGLFLNPTYEGMRIRAERILYFELKSKDHYTHTRSQLGAHLRALSNNAITRRVGYLGTIGGRLAYSYESRRQWLGHVTLSTFLQEMRALFRRRDSLLAGDIANLLKSMES